MGDKTEITKDQAAAFLSSLYPEGDRCYLHNPTRTFFEALLGANAVPSGPDDQLGLNKRLADVLRGIADALDPEEPPQ